MPTPTAITPPPARSSTKTYQAAQQSNTHDNNAVPTDWSTLGTPELHQPKVRQAIAENDGSDNSPSDALLAAQKRAALMAVSTAETHAKTVANDAATIGDIAQTQAAAEAAKVSLESMQETQTDFMVEPQQAVASESGMLRNYVERIVPSLITSKAINESVGKLAVGFLNSIGTKYGWGPKLVAQGLTGDVTGRATWFLSKGTQDDVLREFGIEPADPATHPLHQNTLDDLGPGYLSSLTSIKVAEAVAKYIGPIATQTFIGSAKILAASTAASSAMFVTADAFAKALNQTKFVKDTRTDFREFLDDMVVRVTSDVPVVPDPQDFIGPNGQSPEQFDEWHLPTDPAAYLAVYDAFHGIDRAAEAAELAGLHELWETTYQVGGVPRVDAISFTEFKAQYEDTQAALYDVPHPGDEAGAIQAWLEHSVAAVKDTLVLDEALRIDDPIEVSVLPPVPSAVFGGLLQTETDSVSEVPTVVFVSSRTETHASLNQSESEETDDGDGNELIGGLPLDCLIELWMVPYIARLLALGETDLCRFNDWDVDQLEAYLVKHELTAVDSIAAEVEYDSATGLPLVIFSSTRSMVGEDASEVDESELPPGFHLA